MNRVIEEILGVSEYWIVDPEKEMVEQFVPQEGMLRLAQKSGSGEIASVGVNGFSMPVCALFDAELHLATLRKLVM